MFVLKQGKLFCFLCAKSLVYQIATSQQQIQLACLRSDLGSNHTPKPDSNKPTTDAAYLD
jgi:hypothetical protein